jgi:hypothetical protein
VTLKSIGHVFVHILVQCLFNDPELKAWTIASTVDHIDRNRSNNKAENLTWATFAEQTQNRSLDSTASSGERKKHQTEPWELPGEEWRQLPDHEVWLSNLGRVQVRVAKKIVRYTPGPQPNGNGRSYISIGNVTRQAGNWILRCFVGPPPDGMSCDHFPDRDPKNNKLSNLRWATVAEQNENRCEYRPRTGSTTYGIRRSESDDWIHLTAYEARKKFGIDSSNLGHAANYGFRVSGWLVCKVVDDDQQPLEGEVWKPVIVSEWRAGGKYMRVRNKGRGGWKR